MKEQTHDWILPPSYLKSSEHHSLHGDQQYHPPIAADTVEKDYDNLSLSFKKYLRPNMLSVLTENYILTEADTTVTIP